MKPPYRISHSVLIPYIPSFLFGQRRSLPHDVQRLFGANGNAPRAIDADLIPTHDAFLLVMNHYHRSDIPAWWSALAAFKPISEQRVGTASKAVRLIIASQWTYTQRWQQLVVEPATRFVIGRIVRAYNFVAIEPTALGAAHANQRAQSIRRVLEAAKQAVRNQQVLALAPEGGDSPDGALMHPPAGAGRFMLLLAATGLPLVPVGIFTDGDTLVTRFGESFQLKAPRNLNKSELDEWAAREVMTRIAGLLPANLRGAYDAR